MVIQYVYRHRSDEWIPAKTRDRTRRHGTSSPASRRPTMSEDTETFAFQAEINQLLSLIINVRLGRVERRRETAFSRPSCRRRFFARFSNRRRLTRLATDDGALSRVFDPRRRSIRTRKFSCANSSGARRAVTLARAREGENDDEWRSFFFHRIILRRRIGRG